jgi:N-methylhydantoinase B
MIPAGERLVLETPGGGGYGNPKERPRELVRHEVKLGLVSAQAAISEYGIAPSKPEPYESAGEV